MRNYSVKPPLTIDIIKKRVLLVLQLYDKVNPDKVYHILCILVAFAWAIIAVKPQLLSNDIRDGQFSNYREPVFESSSDYGAQ